VNRLCLAERPSVEADLSRGRDAADLARLRERVERHQDEQLAEIEGFRRVELQRAALVADEARHTAAIEQQARTLEAESRARWMRTLTLQAVVGLGSFVVAELLFMRKRSSLQEAK
jgi:hypothetical protein